MTVNISRNQNASLIEGATDGKYRKRRPDTEVAPGMGDQQTHRSREHLHANMNYGFVNTEASGMVEPTGR